VKVKLDNVSLYSFVVNSLAYLMRSIYIDGVIYFDIPIDHSERRFDHLIKRIEYEPETGYPDFKTNNKNLVGQPIKQMSRLTKALVGNTDYEFVRGKDSFSLLYKMSDNQNTISLKYPLTRNW
jgi:hypothetical protein